jgi:enhancing lycopene biosynthesis protein 2
MNEFAEFQVLSQPPSTVTTPAYEVALVLAGCGARDGTEITEAVSLLANLSEAGFRVQVFAPDRNTAHTINHLTGEQESEGRSMLVEAARIARGKVTPLADLRSARFDALVFAGGFGVAKNLCNYAVAGPEATLSSDVALVIEEFMTGHKPLAALCIAPILFSIYARDKCLKGLAVTFGPDDARSPLLEHVSRWGVRHVPCKVREACIDKRNRVVSAPAYMHAEATPGDVFASAASLVQGLRQLLNQR